MSVKAQLETQQQKLLLQRAGLKDQLESTETALKQISFTINMFKEQDKLDEFEYEESATAMAAEVSNN